MPTDIHPRSVPHIWIQAARPKTLPAAAAPVLMGIALALSAGAFHPVAAALALTAALLIQVGVNFHNDYADFLQGADTEDRVGPLRVTQAGWVDPTTMRRATVAVFALAVAAGTYLMIRGGWPIVAVGIASIASAVWYTAGGSYSLASLGLADVFVLIFFGPVAVGGTYYVQALQLPGYVLAVGLAPGLLSMAILLVNNIRDLANDRAAGRRTLVVRMGRSAAVALYGACFVGALALPVALMNKTDTAWAALLPLVLAPWAVYLVRAVATTHDPAAMNRLLAGTGRFLALYAVLFFIGWTL
ncbi:1,4-dihydroxy-2-naphthoate polyprenyltransferase [Salisaeta longa]|uniref:1,4-dihydroxy-2-naphthoate polyprenyltransferase n=1 Tax=Salisaeta longa TaxID=503170 RepID=UPI0003B68E94|nr:1,4-dihydroxy-2-naphthoate polyprenyltransferase [Salisaeta longa]